ncbi:MAG: ATP synthase F1 subunit gamma [Lachnospiraceae bacterium]|nr:ATP synthase F1 subunit gamma [Lachnospiraceae bacterium]
MPSMIDIKRRKASVTSTQQITKAMKLVSTVKLQKARGRAEQSKPYFDKMYATVTSILKKSGNLNHPYLTDNGSTKKAVIIVSSNRGLAGGYNSNVAKLLTESDLKVEDLEIYGVGKKAIETLDRKGYNIVKECHDMIEEPNYGDAMNLGKEILARFAAGEIGEIYLAYTQFKNTVVHIPTLVKLLPVEFDETAVEENTEDTKTPMNYEPEAEESLDMIIPKYVCSLIYGAFVEAHASENGARMQAMDSATSNAEELIEKLTLQYNRARQGSITQELTEIISGAEALN